MPNVATRYREIEVAGEPRQMGGQIGEAAREEIRGYAEIALERVNKTVRVSRDRALRVAAECIGYVERYGPDMLEELRGMAEGSGLALEELMLLNVRNQFLPETDAGCTSLSVAGHATAEGRPFVAQNWDNDPTTAPFTIVLTRRPTGKPALLNITQAGLIAYIGLSDAGMGMCLNTLSAPSRELGVPHYFTLRGMYEATSLDGAVEAVRRAERAIPANIMLATPQGPADLEVTLGDVYVLRDDGWGLVTHTNHCLHPELVGINEEFPELIQSKPRKARIDYCLADGGPPLTLDRIKASLSDHDNYPTSLCRHPNDDPAHGFWTSVFSVIVDPEAGQMHIARGTPCNHPYETYRLS